MKTCRKFRHYLWTLDKSHSTTLFSNISSILPYENISFIETYPAFAPMWHAWGKFFIDGNYMFGNSTVTADNWTKGIYEQISNESVDNTFTQATKDTMKLVTPIDYLYTTTHTPTVAYENMLFYAGVSHYRDWVDSTNAYF